MVIDENAVLAVAHEEGFNQEYFNSYLRYQKENRSDYPGKWSVEEYAAVMKTRDPEMNFFTHEMLEWFGNWQGFGGEHYIPECLSFLRYCAVRDLYAYQGIEEPLKRNLKKDEI